MSLKPGEPVAQFEIGDCRNFVYLVLDWGSRQAMVVDPQADLAPWRSELENHGFRLAGVLLTHTHFDHVAGVPALARENPRLPIRAHPLDAHRLRGIQTIPVQDGDTLLLGKTRIRVLHTPGHSAGECCYQIEPGWLLTGDTVFVRDCGRTDLETGSVEEMFRSLQRIRELPPDTKLGVGHHYAPECLTTLARELEDSPPFQCRTVEELAALP